MIGIYKIENLVNHKVYIGQSIVVEDRLRHHKQMLNSGKHFCPHLQHSWDKYGENNFSFEILEECLKEEIDAREIYWLDFYGGYESEMTYNQRSAGQETHNVTEETKEKLRKFNSGKKQSSETIAKRAKKLKGHPFWGGKWTEERKKSFSEFMKEQFAKGLRHFDPNNPIYRQHLSAALKGKKKTKEHAQHISEGRKGIVFSEEHKKNISLGRKGIATTPKGSKKMEKDGVVKWARPEEIEQFKSEGWQEYHRFECGDYVRGEPWNKGKHLGESTKEKLKKANLGKKYSKETNMKKGLSGKGKIWIFKGKTNKRINKEDLDAFLQDGWTKGKTRK